MSVEMTKPAFIELCDGLRSDLGAIDRRIVALKEGDKPFGGEVIANLTLAHRHVEDARLRIGKVIQAAEGGKSILDHPEVQALIRSIRARQE